jgi:hypothetical protein
MICIGDQQLAIQHVVLNIVAMYLLKDSSRISCDFGAASCCDRPASFPQISSLKSFVAKCIGTVCRWMRNGVIVTHTAFASTCVSGSAFTHSPTRHDHLGVAVSTRFICLYRFPVNKQHVASCHLGFSREHDGLQQYVTVNMVKSNMMPQARKTNENSGVKCGSYLFGFRSRYISLFVM